MNRKFECLFLAFLFYLCGSSVGAQTAATVLKTKIFLDEGYQTPSALQACLGGPINNSSTITIKEDQGLLICEGTKRIFLKTLVMEEGAYIYIPTTNSAKFFLTVETAEFYGRNVISSLRPKAVGSIPGLSIELEIGRAKLHFDPPTSVDSAKTSSVSKAAMDRPAKQGLSTPASVGVMVRSFGRPGAIGAKGAKGASARGKSCGEAYQPKAAQAGMAGARGGNGSAGGDIKVTVAVEPGNRLITSNSFRLESIGGVGGVGGPGGPGGDGAPEKACLFGLYKRASVPASREAGPQGPSGSQGPAGKVDLVLSKF